MNCHSVWCSDETFKLDGTPFGILNFVAVFITTTTIVGVATLAQHDRDAAGCTVK
jgi:hypothetical protein